MNQCFACFILLLVAFVPQCTCRQNIPTPPTIHKLLNRQATNKSSSPTDRYSNAIANANAHNGTIAYQPVSFDVKSECLLWDDTCPGDMSTALVDFFNDTVPALMGDLCFTDDYSEYNCPDYPVQSSSVWSEVKSILRAPTCGSLLNEAMSIGKFTETPNQPGCPCGSCGIGGPNVDVYYWQSPDANTSCLSIVGSKANPPLAGATSSDGLTYWGYTDKAYGYIETMIYTSINGVTFKMPLVDPYSSCSYSGEPTTDPLIGETLGDGFRLLKARANPMTIPIQPRAPVNLGNYSSPAGNGSIETTVIYQGHTFTSPSIYVNFYSLSATDSCGLLGGGPGGIITSTLIAFAPGELSTLALPLNEWEHGLQPDLTKYYAPYNIADLPCPPYNTMCAQWYKPELGEPYRPIIAFPSKVLSLDPLWQSCTLGLFTGLDPPTALQPATALAPLVTPAGNADPKQVEAKPSPNPETMPANTAKPSAAATVGTAQLVPAATSTAASDPAINDPTDPDGETNPQLPVVSDPIEDGSKANLIGEESGQSVPPVNILATPTSLDPSDNTEFGSKAPALPFVFSDPLNALTEGQLTTIHNQVVQPLSHGISIAGTTLIPGALPITVSGTPISYASSALVVGTSTIPLAPKVPLPVSFNALTEGQITTINQQAVQQLSHGISILGTTLTPGAPHITISGTPVAYGPSVLVVGTSTVPLASDSEFPSPTTTTIAGQAVTIGQNTVGIAGAVLSPGGPAITVSGTPISLGSSALIIGTSTVPLASQASKPFITTVAGHAITAAPNAVTVAGTTLRPGLSGVTLDGTVVSLDTAGRLVVGSKTMPLTSESAGSNGLIVGGFGNIPPSEVSNALITTIAGQAVTAASTAVAFAGTTLTPGAPGKTIKGTLVSLNAAGQLVVNSKTITLDSNGAGSGGLIMGGFGAGGPFDSNSPSPTQVRLSNGTSNTSVQVFQGKAEDLKSLLSWKKVAVSMVAMIIMIQM